MAATAVAAIGVGVSAYSAYEQIDTGRKAQNVAEENQAKLEAAAAAEEAAAAKAAESEQLRATQSKRQALADLLGRRGRASTILTGGTARQTLGQG